MFPTCFIRKNIFFYSFQVRASIRTVNPKQLQYEDWSDTKFKHSVFMRNMNRVKAATANINPAVIGAEIKYDCFA